MAVHSLKDVSFFFIVDNVCAFPLEALSQLPLRVRRHILRYLSAVDIWYLETSTSYMQGIDVEELWKRRIETHIHAWIPPKGLPPFAENEKLTAKEKYLVYLTRLLLSSTEEELSQSNSHYFGFFGDGEFYRQSKFSLRLRRSGERSADLLDKAIYIDFLLHGIYMPHVPRLLEFFTYPFQSRGEYRVAFRYSSMARSLEYRRSTYVQPLKCFTSTVNCILNLSGWLPEKLEIITPSQEFVQSLNNEHFMTFLSSVKEISIKINNNQAFPEIASILSAFFEPKSKLSITNMSIETERNRQLDWVLSKLEHVCGSMTQHDFETLRPHHIYTGYNKLRKISIKNGYAANLRVNWIPIFCQAEIESISLTNCMPNRLLQLLAHLLTTRPTMKHLELTACGIDYSSMQQLVSTFLSTETNHPQTLAIKDNKKDIILSNLPCENGKYKALCIPFILNGPCSLSWLLAYPKLALKSLELCVPENQTDNLKWLHMILGSYDRRGMSLGFPVIVTIESQVPSSTEQKNAAIIYDLAMCNQVNEVRIV